MTATAVDRKTSYREGIELDFPVKASTKIPAGVMVCVDSTGYAVNAANTSGHIFVGVSTREADNSGSVVNGAISVQVRTEGVFEFAASSIAITNVGADMYVVDNQTFDESDPGNGITCGKLVKYVSATKGWIKVGRAVATAIAGSADALTVSDAGDYFAAATNTVAEQIQQLAAVPIMLTFSAATIATAASDAKIAENFEFPVPVRIKRAYATLGTAPGTGKTLTIEITVAAGADATLCTVTGTNTTGEDEALDIAIAANTDVDIQLTQDTGAAAGLNLVVVAVLDDGE
jgi:hypothetical protein